ncbi:hypothetical protein AsFPU3_1228 [Aphanothece sacrum FPU3]|nr:hypothetical protein AsFPU3_1228 [Aphanothece sacrum FPU3]
MNLIWDQITLSYFSASKWLNASYIYRLVGIFSQWRQHSFLLQWGEAIGALLLSLVFIFSLLLPLFVVIAEGENGPISGDRK